MYYETNNQNNVKISLQSYWQLQWTLVDWTHRWWPFRSGWSEPCSGSWSPGGRACRPTPSNCRCPLSESQNSSESCRSADLQNTTAFSCAASRSSSLERTGIWVQTHERESRVPRPTYVSFKSYFNQRLTVQLLLISDIKQPNYVSRMTWPKRLS